MKNSIDDINENALYVLKVEKDGKFLTDYFNIDKTLTSEIRLNELYQIVYEKNSDKELKHKDLFELRKNAVLKFYENIYLNFNFLMGYRSYCRKTALRSSYCEFKGINSNSDINISEYSTSIDNNNILMQSGINRSWQPIRWYTDDFVASYLMEQTYKKCIEDHQIKVYSHRRVGWTSYNFELNNILSVNIDTNFSFGSASYFTITLVYNNIKIIPYSRLVLYHFANTMQLIRHTREYSVSDNSWVMALDFVRDACNELIERGEKSFIAKYITNECEVLYKLLPNYLVSSQFNLSENMDGTYYYDNDDKLQQVKLNGYSLVVFRGEKISGAVDFTESIKELNIILPTQKYIDCIFECCLNIKPTIDNTLIEIEEIIPILEIELSDQEKLCDEINNKLKPLNDQLAEFDKIKATMREQIYEENKNSEGVSSKYSTLIENILIEKYDKEHIEYVEIKNTVEALKRDKNEQSEKRNAIYNKNVELKNFRNSLTRHRNNIINFIEKNRNETVKYG